MKTIKLAPGERLVTNQLNRKGVLPQNIVDAARDIVANVRANGDAAVRDYCQRFDGVELQSFRLPQEQIDAALEGLDPAFVAALEKAARQIREFHQREVEQSWFTTRADGTMLGVKVTPLAAAGIYVPGGRAQYPSTVLMNAIPAKVAGVKRVVMVTPPQKDGLISPYTLAAAKLGGVDEIYMVGGAQAVAALAYGTETIPRVEKITGPGNAFVAAAKQIVSGDVGIDMVAGPSEVCVLADATAKPMVVAADLMAQAEHDPLAACYLVTCDEQFAREVEAGIDVLVAQSPRAEITRASLDNEGIIVVADDMAAAVEAVNTVAPEHLELHCKDAMGLLGGIRNAGAIFVGAWSSEPLGDYVAGPNHTLPTGGTAMFSNPLSVEEFVKRSSVICYTPEGLLSDAPATQRLAEAEGLWAHALSAALRRRVLEQGEDAVSAASLAAADLTKVAWPGDAVATVAEGVDLAAAGADGAGATGGGPNMAELTPRMKELVQPYLAGIEPYDPNFTPTCINLSANENTYPAPVGVREAIDAALVATPLNRYPDPMSNDLRDELAAWHGVTRENICVGNGGDELLYNYLLAFGGAGRTLLNCPPCFSEYAFFASLCQTEVRDVWRDPASFELDQAAVLAAAPECSLAIVTSPNNPTGDVAPLDFVAALCDACPGMVMVDEAYVEFADDSFGAATTAQGLIAEHSNLVILHTLSKAFGAAGARLGYVIAAPEVIEVFAAIRQIYSVNVLSQAAALACVRARDAYAPVVAQVASERERELCALRAMAAEGLPVEAWPSAANFVLVRTPHATRVRERLRDEYSILVRDFSYAPGLADCLRITVGTPQENDEVLVAFAALVKEEM